jgi:protein-disulfide isomerase
MNITTRPGLARPRAIGRWSAAFLLFGAALLGCSSGSGQEPEVLATVDGEPVTMADVEAIAGDELARMELDYNKRRRQLVEAALRRALRDRLLEREAAAQGLSLDEFVAQELEGKTDVSDAEVEGWYRQNQAALGGRALEELREPIREFLSEQKRQGVLNALGQRLREGVEIVILLEPLRVELNNEGAPALGPSDAPVTLVEFSDFECPFCGQFFQTMKRLKETYGDQLRVVYRQFPLEMHSNSFKAAEASLCADEQGRFWEMHDLLFSEQDRLDVESLKEKADRIGLDRAAFDECLDSGRQVERIRRDVQEGSRLGVQGTPALFLNGIPLSGGAIPYTVVAEAIDAELQRVGARR